MPDKTKAILTVEQLTVNNSYVVVDTVDLSINEGEIVAVIGPNGSGKTSLLKSISNEMKSDSGNIQLAGEKMSDWPLPELAKHLAFLPQQSQLKFAFTVKEVIEFGRFPHGAGKVIDSKVVIEIAEILGLLEFMDRSYINLSGGEQQRVQLARVLAQVWREEDATPRLLLLDEPMNNLDIAYQNNLMQAIKHMVYQGVAVLMVLHDINLAISHADQLLALKRGKMLAKGSPSSIVTSEFIYSLFDVKAKIIQHPDTQKPLVVFT